MWVLICVKFLFLGWCCFWFFDFIMHVLETGLMNCCDMLVGGFFCFYFFVFVSLGNSVVVFVISCSFDSMPGRFILFVCGEFVGMFMFQHF